MKVVPAVPTETISEKLSVQRLSEAIGVRHLRANVYTLAEPLHAELLRDGLRRYGADDLHWPLLGVRGRTSWWRRRAPQSWTALSAREAGS